MALLAISPQSGIAAPAPSVCGELSQTGTDSGTALYGWGTPCSTGSNAGGYTVSNISYWVGSPTSTSFDLGIYADSSGSPATLLCHASTGTVTPSSGWNSITISGCPTLSANSTYWVGYINGNNQIQQGTARGLSRDIFSTPIEYSAQSSANLPWRLRSVDRRNRFMLLDVHDP